MKLSPAQRKGLEILSDGEKYSPREFARKMWPDSPAWNRRSRGQRGTNHSGAMASTMPMLGAKLLWKLWDLGLATEVQSDLNARTWVITERGRQRLTEPS
jgi:hypothetical protein